MWTVDRGLPEVCTIPEPQVRGPPKAHCSFRPERPEVTKFLGSSASSFLLNLTAAQTPEREILGLHLSTRIHTTNPRHSPRIAQNTVANFSARLHNLFLHIRLKANNTQISLKGFPTRWSRVISRHAINQLLPINILDPYRPISTLVDNPKSSSEMAPMNNQNLNYSSNYGEAAAQKVNVLASCYLVDSAANLKGLHYCTTGVAGAEWYS
ncbi:ornithine decarboxylase antizyme [Fusarium tjaetaba]|uniref:Ornithine decarboxylase antizyme n=1 Tax=Fusarium tjaetaba TaxID=1567544 RepID=A0A8H5S6X8_9HYPO|nr:ornithine decarboxylase antizyme [Fusarium tjaetaba]KAF5646482.1 ornithine decarboxylase antizyme [Fusarium tjaetaba]